MIWKNGQILPESEAKLSVYDSALMFGDMVFEMTRSFNGKQFMLREHLERLYRSIKYVQIPLEMTIDELETACLQVAEANQFGPDDEHRLMINVTRGPLAIYSKVESLGPNVLITDFPLRWTVAGMGKLFDIGINAVTPSQRAIPAYLLDPKVKCRSRMHYQMANIEVSHYKTILDGHPVIESIPNWPHWG
jgi:branched-chain amino acid aminotransferase